MSSEHGSFSGKTRIHAQTMQTSPALIRHGMVLAAGLGERMRPLTNTTPKPMLKVAGQPLVDHALDRMEDAGVEQAVVNTFYLAEILENHLAHRPSPYITISREEERLETGGGIRKALPHLGNAPFYVANGDAFWLNGPTDALGRMAEQWNDSAMDALLLLHSTVDAYGYGGRGDFLVEPDGQLSRRPEQEVCPYLFTGIQILHPRLFEQAPDGVFSLNILYDRAIENGRLFGVVHDGEWFHIGTPAGLAEAETYMKHRYAGVQHR